MNYDYTLSCSGVGGNATGSARLAVTAGVSNTASVTIDNGPAAAGSALNTPYVSVTVCRPGTSIYQTIDRVLLDTGSYGLRLLAPLDAALALPVVHTSSGAGECEQFVSGFGLGALQQADVKTAGETASGQSVQVIGVTPRGSAGILASCTATGGNFGTVATLGANGIFGVGQFKQDCGDGCGRSAAGGVNNTRSAASCVATSMPLALQVSNPGASFMADNNGVILSLRAVSTGGMTVLSGTLIFGIGTQSNNSLGGETKYAPDGNGNFSPTLYLMDCGEQLPLQETKVSLCPPLWH